VIAYALAVAAFGGCIGALLGFIVLLVFAEWLFVNWFGNHDLLEGLLGAVLVGGGAFVGSRLILRAAGRGR
jgi:hypothetical protein